MTLSTAPFPAVNSPTPRTSSPLRSTPLTTTPEVASVIRRIAADQRLWRPAVRFGRTQRYWTRLPGPDGVDV